MLLPSPNDLPLQYLLDQAARDNIVLLFRVSAGQTIGRSKDRIGSTPSPPHHRSRDGRRSWSSLRLCDQARDFIQSSNHCFYATGQQARRARKIYWRKGCIKLPEYYSYLFCNLSSNRNFFKYKCPILRILPTVSISVRQFGFSGFGSISRCGHSFFLISLLSPSSLTSTSNSRS